PSACTLTLYGANGHVTGALLSTTYRTTANWTRWQPTLRQGWRTKSLNANEFLAMVAQRSFYHPEDHPRRRNILSKGWCQCLVGSNPSGVSARRKLDKIANT